MAFGIEKINWEKIKSFTGNAFVEEKLVTEANFTAMMIEN